jgi:hypothetical protein
MSAIAGRSVNSQNPILRFCLIAFLGSVGLGLVLSWRATSFLVSEYQEMPQSARMVKIKNNNLNRQHLINPN